MKQRVTFVQPEGTGIEKTAIHVNPDSLVFSNSHNAALEKRVTAGLKELPEEITNVLNDCHELHMRWISPNHYDLPSPLVSRLPPGLHVFYTPRKANQEADICQLLHKLFGQDLKCHSVPESFSRPPILSERFSHSSSYQYHQVLPSLAPLKTYLSKTICPSNLKTQLTCETEAEALEHAAHLDIDFDTISHAVTLTAAWSPDAEAGARPGSGITSRAIVKLRENDGIEVGVLQGEKADEVEELSLGGYLTVIGEQDAPSGTLFSFPSRHHSLPSSHTFTSSFPPPTGLHPKLILTLPPTSLIPPQPSCALHAYLTLPSPLFLDRHQLSDTLFLSSQNLRRLHSLSGATDLEAPDWVVKTWGSAALLELALPDPVADLQRMRESWHVTIPTHLRYVQPPSSNSTAPSSHAHLPIPPPSLFWACTADEGLKFKTNPFDRVDLGYDGLFGPKTMFHHLSPAPSVDKGDLMLYLQVPVLDPKDAGWVQPATTVVVVMGFVWVLWKLFAGVMRKVEGSGMRAGGREGKKTQ